MTGDSILLTKSREYRVDKCGQHDSADSLQTVIDQSGRTLRSAEYANFLLGDPKSGMLRIPNSVFCISRLSKANDGDRMESPPRLMIQVGKKIFNFFKGTLFIPQTVYCRGSFSFPKGQVLEMDGFELTLR